MKIGMPNYPRANLYKEIKWIGKHRFDFIDLFMEADMAVLEKVDPIKVRKLLKKYNLGVVGHTSWYLPISAPLKSLREASVKIINKHLEFFSQIGVKKVTIHTSSIPGIFVDKDFVKYHVESLRKIVKEGKKYNIKIMLEPSGLSWDTYKNISQILKRIPGLYLHLDIGHENLRGKKVEQFIEKFHKKIIHVHLHDNYGRDDLHLPLGVGHINWKKLIKTLKKYYNDTITLEVFAPDRDYLLISREKLKKLWKSS